MLFARPSVRVECSQGIHKTAGRAAAGDPTRGAPRPRRKSTAPGAQREHESWLHARSPPLPLCRRAATSPTLLLLPSWMPEEKSESGTQRPIRMPGVRGTSSVVWLQLRLSRRFLLGGRSRLGFGAPTANASAGRAGAGRGLWLAARGRPHQDRGGRRRMWPLGHASNSEACLQGRSPHRPRPRSYTCVVHFSTGASGPLFDRREWSTFQPALTP
jgi:hypothetical protein